MSDSAAIVTAAGASRRMGELGHKALLDWGGRPLVAHQVETLRSAGFAPVVVVTGSEADAVADATPEGAEVVHNAEWQSGRSRSIAAGAEAVPDDVEAVLVVAVDQPVSARVLEQLRPAAGQPVVQPLDEQRGPGHPAILGGDHLGALRRLEEQPQGLRSLVRRLRPRGTMVPVEELPHWDLNTPEAYRRARASLYGESSS